MEGNQKKIISIDRAIFDNIDNVFFLIDESGKIIHYNFQVKVQLFYSDSQLTNKNFFSLIMEKNHDQFKQIMLQVQTKGTSHSKTIELGDSLGKYTKYKLLISLEKDSPDSGAVFIILGQKIAPPHKFAHLLDFPDNLFPSEFFMGKVFDESRYGIAVFDIKGNVLQVNRVILNYWNIKMLQNYNFFKDPVFEKNEVLEKIQRVIDTKIPAQTKPFLYNSHEYDPSFPDQPIWLQVMIFTLSENGDPPRIVLMFRDTTEQSEKEQSVEAYQKELEALLTKRALAEKVLAHISSRFVKPEGFESMDNFNAIVTESMQEIGEFSQADEIFIIQTLNIPESPVVSLTHEWCKTPKICFQDQIQNIPYPNYSYWASVFPGDAPVIINRDYNPDRLGPFFEKLIESFNISTLAVYSLKIQNRITGLVGIVSTQESLEWKESDLTVLQVFSEMLGNYFERYQTFQALSSTEEKYRTLIETTSDLIFLLNPDGKFLFTNSATTKILGYTPVYLLSIDIASLVHPDDKALSNLVIDTQFSQSPPQPIQNMEVRLRTKSGSYVWFAVNITPVLEKDSLSLSHLVCVSRNITELKQKNREIRNNELQIQYTSVISMISSMLITDMPDLEKKMQDILPTLGHIMHKSCNLILLLQNFPDSSQSKRFEIKGSWTTPDFQLDKAECETFLSKSLFTPITEQLTEKLYKTLSLSSLSLSIQEQARPFQLWSMLSVPIFAGSELYGILLLNSREDYIFSQKETTLFLNVGILIGFSIQNQFTQKKKAHFYDALHDGLNSAVFILQENRYIYVNRAFEKLTGHSSSELHGYDNIFSHTDPSNEQVITKLRKAWETSSQMGISLEFEIQKPERSIPCHIILSKGYFAGKDALFGIITEKIP
ncbi:MAG: PAS domain S-box protein [Promethearchaeota archaeon]